MIFDDSCRHCCLFPVNWLAGRSTMTRDQYHWHRSPYPNSLTLLGDLPCTCRFPANNILIITWSRPEDPLRGHALPSRGRYSPVGFPTPPTRICPLVFAYLDSRLDADSRTGTSFARWPRLLCSHFISDTVKTGGSRYHAVISTRYNIRWALREIKQVKAHPLSNEFSSDRSFLFFHIRLP
jgi:hypothetical protein